MWQIYLGCCNMFKYLRFSNTWFVHLDSLSRESNCDIHGQRVQGMGNCTSSSHFMSYEQNRWPTFRWTRTKKVRSYNFQPVHIIKNNDNIIKNKGTHKIMHNIDLDLQTTQTRKKKIYGRFWCSWQTPLTIRLKKCLRTIGYRRMNTCITLCPWAVLYRTQLATVT